MIEQVIYYDVFGYEVPMFTNENEQFTDQELCDRLIDAAVQMYDDRVIAKDTLKTLALEIEAGDFEYIRMEEA